LPTVTVTVTVRALANVIFCWARAVTGTSAAANANASASQIAAHRNSAPIVMPPSEYRRPSPAMIVVSYWLFTSASPALIVPKT